MLNKLKVMLLGGKPKHERRRAAPSGPPPKPGRHMVRQRVVMAVTEVLSPDLWDWFVLMGWREIDLKTNRREVKLLPMNTFSIIARASISERESVYRQIIK